MEAQIVSMYLITSPLSNMIGLYYCPLHLIAHETGLGLEGALKGLRRGIEAGFCEYDEGTETVWVKEMARIQIDSELKPNDLRVKGIQNQYDALHFNPFLPAFFDKYARAFHMKTKRDFPASQPPKSEAPSKPLRSQEQEQEQKQEQEQEQKTLCRARPDGAVGLRLIKDHADQKKDTKKNHADAVRQVIDHLNAKTGRKFTDVEANAKLIRARISEGSTVADLLGVIDLKTAQWLNNPKMNQFLRPATLFNSEKFNQYVGELGCKNALSDQDEINEIFGMKKNSDFIDVDFEELKRE